MGGSYIFFNDRNKQKHLQNGLLAIIIIIMLIGTNLFIITNISNGAGEANSTIPSEDDALRTSGSLPRNRQPLGFIETSTGLPTTGNYDFIVSGDINSDGEIDLAFSAQDEYGPPRGVYAYTGNGGASWTNTSTGLINQYSWAGVALADADLDGYTEYYATDESWGNHNNNGLKVWEYRGSTWTDSSSHVSTPYPSGTCNNVLLENITGDNKIDLIICKSSGIKYYENNGSNPVNWDDKSGGLNTSRSYTAVTAADMNKDGLKDIVACDYSGGEHLFIQNTSTPQWSYYGAGLNLPSRTCLGVAVGDVNGDSHMDVVFGGHANSGLRCLLGNSGGVSGTSFSWTPANIGFPSNHFYFQIQLVDIDADGDLDILAPEYNNNNIGIELYLGNGTTNPGMNMGWTLASNTNLPTTGKWCGANYADINGDGSFDIFGASWGGGVKAWLNNITPDITPPGTVTDLVISNVTINSIKVNWSAPVNNSTNTSSGPVKSYDIRYSFSNINAGNWLGAIECDNEPTPGSPGTPQGLKISGLLPGTLYYIGLRSLDERPNISPLSNIVYNTTLGIPDTTQPRQITDLQALNPTNNSINLTWSAPADNGSDTGSGSVSEYNIRYYSAEITNSTWASATICTTPISPSTPGSTETYTVTNLQAETTYYFAIKAGDEKPNWGGISNSPYNTTLPNPDIIPPNPITDLLAIHPTDITINLTWTASGDNNNTGNASYYDIRHSTEFITDLTWQSAIQCNDAAIPQDSGNSEYYNVTGLNPDTKYYFAIKAGDETPIWSGLSNIASNTTLTSSDTILPSRITDLSAGQTTSTSVILTWTAPGDEGDTGLVSGYEIRYHTSSITDVLWEVSTLCPDYPTPESYGELQAYTVTGLLSSTKYYFAVKAFDERPNYSPLSNSPMGVTLGTIKPDLKVIMRPEKTILNSGESIELEIEVLSMLRSQPIPEVTVDLSSDNPRLTISPAFGITDQDGVHSVTLTTETVTTTTVVTIIAKAEKLGFKPNHTQVSIIMNPPLEEQKFNLHITSSDITFSNDSITAGDVVTIYGNITNTGIRTAIKFTVKFYIDDTQIGDGEIVPGLQAGNYKIAEASWTASGGNHTVRVKIIPSESNFESDSSDNTAEKRFTVAVKPVEDEGDPEDNTDSSANYYWLWMLIIVIIIVIFLLVFLVVRKRKHELEEPSRVDNIRVPEEVKTEPRSELEPTAKSTESQESIESEPVEPEPTPTKRTEEKAEPMEVPRDETTLQEVTQNAQEPGADGISAPDLQQIQHVPCPICQNLITVYTTPCPECGTNLNWD